MQNSQIIHGIIQNFNMYFGIILVRYTLDLDFGPHVS